MAENTKEEMTDERPMRRLKDAVRLVREKQADGDDVVVEMKQAERARLELLADELQPLMADIDDADERFDLALSSGERPRLWIDMVSFVAMGHDRRTYRLIKETRAGRLVLAESEDMERAADFVGQYVAERVLERERVLEGDRASLLKVAGTGAPPAPQRLKGRKRRAVLWFLIGVLSTLGLIAALALFLVPEAF